GASKSGEVGVHRQADALALFWVELAGHQVVAPDHGDERSGMIGRGGDVLWVGDDGMVGMDGVDGGGVAHALEDWRGPRDAKRVPAHVRDFQARGGSEPDDAAGDQAKSLVQTVFLAHVEEEL